jgi:tripartite-type tricarboxylate transporter receptor subunit TctC
MKELHELGRKNPGGLTLGTPGLGSPSHLLGAKVLLADNVPFETVHYRGGAPMMADLVTGRVDFSWPTLSTSGPYIADKKLQALAIDADARWPRLPDVSTLNELGFGKERVASWFAVAAPSGTPSVVVDKLNALFIKASQDPELRRRLDENGTPIATSTPEPWGKPWNKNGRPCSSW